MKPPAQAAPSDPPPPSPTAAFLRSYTIRFAHCDPAGLVFFPQYFVLFNDHLEDWFAQALGLGFRELHLERRLGIPTVRIECDFERPSRLGDELEFLLSVERLGRSSIALQRQARAPDGVRVRLRQVLALVDLDSGKPIPWPQELRASIAPFVSPQA